MVVKVGEEYEKQYAMYEAMKLNYEEEKFEQIEQYIEENNMAKRYT